MTMMMMMKWKMCDFDEIAMIEKSMRFARTIQGKRRILLVANTSCSFRLHLPHSGSWNGAFDSFVEEKRWEKKKMTIQKNENWNFLLRVTSTTNTLNGPASLRFHRSPPSSLARTEFRRSFDERVLSPKKTPSLGDTN